MSTSSNLFSLYWTFISESNKITKYNLPINYLIEHIYLKIDNIIDDNCEVDLNQLVEYFVTSGTYTKYPTSGFLMSKGGILGIIISVSIIEHLNELKHKITQSFEQY